MAGAHVGRLNVYSTGLYENDKLLWRLFGDQTDTWKEAHVPVNIIQPQYQVNLSPHLKVEKNHALASFEKYTAVSTKVVPQKRKSVRDNTDWYYG